MAAGCRGPGQFVDRLRLCWRMPRSWLSPAMAGKPIVPRSGDRRLYSPEMGGCRVVGGTLGVWTGDGTGSAHRAGMRLWGRRVIYKLTDPRSGWIEVGTPGHRQSGAGRAAKGWRGAARVRIIRT